MREGHRPRAGRERLRIPSRQHPRGTDAPRCLRERIGGDVPASPRGCGRGRKPPKARASPRRIRPTTRHPFRSAPRRAHTPGLGHGQPVNPSPDVFKASPVGQQRERVGCKPQLPRPDGRHEPVPVDGIFVDGLVGSHCRNTSNNESIPSTRLCVFPDTVIRSWSPAKGKREGGGGRKSTRISRMPLHGIGWLGVRAGWLH